MRRNRHCQIYWQILHTEKNVMRSTVVQVRGRRLLLEGKTLGLRCSADAERVMYNKCRRDADRSWWCWCRQRAQIFCPRHLYFCRNRKVTPRPVFYKFLTSDPGQKEKRRILLESTPDPVPPLVSRHVSRPVFSSLGLECLRSRRISVLSS